MYNFLSKMPRRFGSLAKRRETKPATGGPTITATAMAMSRTALPALERRGDRKAVALLRIGAALFANPLPRCRTATAIRAQTKPVLRRSRNSLPRTKRAPRRKCAAGASGECDFDLL
jgi:hypothetical protein